MERCTPSCWLPRASRSPRALALASAVASGENSQPLRPAVLIGDDLLRIFQDGKDAAQQVDPPQTSLGTAFEPQPSPPFPSDYR